MKKIVFVLSVCLMVAGIAQAGVYNYVGDGTDSMHWNAAAWQLNGTSHDPVEPTAGNTYVVTDKIIRTHSVDGTAVFLGDCLELQGGSSIFALKDSCSVNLIMGADTTLANYNGGDQVYGTITTVGSGSITMLSEMDVTITINSLMTIGSGISSIIVDCGTGSGNGSLHITDGGNTFTGTWNVVEGILKGTTAGSLGASSFDIAARGSLDFDYDFSNEAGDLTMAEDSKLYLDQDLTFESATIWGVKLPDKTYDADDLINSLGINAAAFEDGLSSTGTITISEPLGGTVYNYVGDGTDSTHWNTAAWQLDGTSDDPVVPAAGNTYVVTDKIIRTHAVVGTAVFLGDCLELQGGSSIFALKDSCNVNLIMGADTTLANYNGGDQVYGTITTVGSGSITMLSELDVTITINSMMTIGSGISSIIVDCNDEWISNGVGSLHITDGGNTFTGTWNVVEGILKGTRAGSLGASSFDIAARGSLDFDYDFSNKAGDLTMAEDSTLYLDQDLTFDSATIWGIELPEDVNKTYDAADLITTLGINADAFEDGLSSTGTITIFEHLGTVIFIK